MAGAVDRAVGSLAAGALGFNAYKKNCGPGTLCSDAVRGWQQGGKRRSRKTRHRHK